MDLTRGVPMVQAIFLSASMENAMVKIQEMACCSCMVKDPSARDESPGHVFFCVFFLELGNHGESGEIHLIVALKT